MNKLVLICRIAFILHVATTLFASEAGEIDARLNKAETAISLWNFEKAGTIFNDLLTSESLTQDQRGRALRGRILRRALVLTEYPSVPESYDLFLKDALELIRDYPEFFDLWCANRVKVPPSKRNDEASAQKLLDALDANKNAWSKLDYHLLRGELVVFWSDRLEGRKHCTLQQAEFKKSVKADPDSYLAWERYLDVLWSRKENMGFFEKRRFLKMITRVLEENAHSFRCSPFQLYDIFQQREDGSPWTMSISSIREGMKRFPADPLPQFECIDYLSKNPDTEDEALALSEEFMQKHQAGKFRYETEWKKILPLKVLYKLGHLYHTKGRLEEALEAYENIQNMSPHYAETHYNVGVVCCSLADREKDEKKRRSLWKRALEQFLLQRKYMFQNTNEDPIRKFEQKVLNKLGEDK